MAVDLVLFDAFPRDGLAVRPHRVYLRSRWDRAWQHVPYLYCNEATWSVAPQISTAVLQWRFGQAIPPDKTTAGWFNRKTGILRSYVKIVFDTHPIPVAGVNQTAALTWVGTIEVDNTNFTGLQSVWKVLNKETGSQDLVCYGLEHTLSLCPLDRGHWLDTENRMQVARRNITFNAPDTVGKLLGNHNAQFVPTFNYLPLDTPVAEWSTRKIVSYLLQAFPPLDVAGNPVMPLTLLDPQILPNNDQPVFDATGMNLWQAICNLIVQTRLMGCYLKYDEAANAVRVQPYSLIDRALQAGDILIPANPRQRRIDFDLDADVERAAVKVSSVKQVHQLILRGARRTSTGTLSYADETLDLGWNDNTVTPDEQDYEAAGSVDAGYAALGVADKQKLNAEVRASAALHEVYRYFVHHGDAWDQKVGNGEGTADQVPLFPDDANAARQAWVYPRELFVLPCVLLQEAKDYSVLSAGENPPQPPPLNASAHSRQAPLVFFKVPAESDADRYWIEATKIGQNANLEETEEEDNRRWSARIEVPPQAYGLLVHVDGQPQHVIAKSDFNPLPVDEIVGDFDWKEMVVTLSFEDDRHCEGRWPPDVAVALQHGPREHIRRHVIYCGDEYRQDWLAPNTVVGVNSTTGALVRNVAGGWIQNDTLALTDRARQLFEYFGRQRNSLTFATRRVNSALQRGDYIVEIGDLNDTPIGGVITQIRLASPEGNSPPTLTYETSHLDLEAIQP